MHCVSFPITGGETANAMTGRGRVHKKLLTQRERPKLDRTVSGALGPPRATFKGSAKGRLKGHRIIWSLSEGLRTTISSAAWTLLAHGFYKKRIRT